MKDYRILTVGDSAVTVDFGNEISPALNGRVHSLKALLSDSGTAGITDMIPTFRSLLICYDPLQITYKKLCRTIDSLASRVGEESFFEPKVYVIPVLYGDRFGEDLPFVASHAGLSEQEVIDIHSAPDYLIYMLGFLPGFSYLGGLDSRIESPRLPQPRQIISAGSVGIGGNQTGIYPLDSPGGWRLIGRTPVRPYDKGQILYRAGDYIRFRPVERAEYDEIESAVAAGDYRCESLERGAAR